MTVKNTDQRVGIFIDVQNLYYSARALYGTKVNFGEIVRTATAGRKLIRAIAYAVKAEMPEEQSFFDALEKAGLEVKTKDLQTFVSGQKKADWDVGIAVDILNMAPKLDAIILCSGDGDFQILMHQAKTEGCRAEVMSFGRSTSAKLIEESDDFVDMDLEPERYLLNFKKPMPKTQSPAVTNNRQPKSQTAVTPGKITPVAPEATSSLEGDIINAINNEPKPEIPKKRRFFGKN
ncbi:MAG: NYN domain-containing protein [bacterium]